MKRCYFIGGVWDGVCKTYDTCREVIHVMNSQNSETIVTKQWLLQDTITTNITFTEDVYQRATLNRMHFLALGDNVCLYIYKETI